MSHIQYLFYMLGCFFDLIKRANYVCLNVIYYSIYMK